MIHDSPVGRGLPPACSGHPSTEGASRLVPLPRCLTKGSLRPGLLRNGPNHFIFVVHHPAPSAILVGLAISMVLNPIQSSHIQVCVQTMALSCSGSPLRLALNGLSYPDRGGSGLGSWNPARYQGQSQATHGQSVKPFDSLASVPAPRRSSFHEQLVGFAPCDGVDR